MKKFFDLTSIYTFPSLFSPKEYYLKQGFKTDCTWKMVSKLLTYIFRYYSIHLITSHSAAFTKGFLVFIIKILACFEARCHNRYLHKGKNNLLDSHICIKNKSLIKIFIIYTSYGHCFWKIYIYCLSTLCESNYLLVTYSLSIGVIYPI